MNELNLQPTNNLFADCLCRELDTLDLHYEAKEIDGGRIIGINLPGGKIGNLLFTYLVRENGQCTITHQIIRQTLHTQRAELLEMLNEFNTRQRYVKFSMEEGGRIQGEYEFILPDPSLCNTSELGAFMFSLLVMAADTLDDYCPELLVTIWSGLEELKAEAGIGAL